MLPLQHARLWRVLSTLLLLFVLAGTMTPTFFFSNKEAALFWFEDADKWLHGITFLILAAWFAGLFERPYWRILVGLSFFGILVEGCQMLLSYRTADWIDIAANTIGILTGLAIARAGLGGWGPRLEAWYARQHQH